MNMVFRQMSPASALIQAMEEQEKGWKRIEELRIEVRQKIAQIRAALSNKNESQQNGKDGGGTLGSKGGTSSICIEKVDPEARSQRFLAVDSAFHKEQYEFATEYRLVAVALADNESPWNVSLFNFPAEEVLAMVEVDEEQPEGRLLEGLAASMELILASKGLGEFPVVHIDGSFATFIIKLNSIITFLAPLLTQVKEHHKAQERLHFLETAWQLSLDAIGALAELLSPNHTVIAWPKASRQNPVVNMLSEPLGIFPWLSDFLVLQEVLEEGEWLALPPQKRTYNLPKPKKGWHNEVNEGLEAIQTAMQHVLERISGVRTIYFKGISGKIFKMETASSVDPSPFFRLTMAQEFLPLLQADAEARSLLNLLARPAPNLRFYRERR